MEFLAFETLWLPINFIVAAAGELAERQQKLGYIMSRLRKVPAACMGSHMLWCTVLMHAYSSEWSGTWSVHMFEA